ncbi:MAG TPA: DUF3592 domain-containing protein [Thermoanaerobaculia bacterium]|jgi:hypothetical protein|nr:DUF3592 domain-containing protein [Thermoanaerobaculia bacterium]
MRQSVHLGMAPRRVPVSLQIANFFNGIAQVGWAVFGFGMIFFWGFVFNADFSFATFRGPYATVDGKVTKVESTNASQNKSRVQANHYEYSVAGVTHTGVSYSNSQSVSPGESVTIEYAEGSPGKSRIAGMRRAIFSPAVAFVIIFPLVGFLILYFATRSGIKRNRLLREGVVAEGTFKSKAPTNVTVNGRRVYALTFDFVARDGQHHEVTTRTSDSSRLQDEDTEPLLYDPNDPTSAYLLDEMPARPEIEANGDLSGKVGGAVRMLILPAIVIVGHGMVLLAKLGLL